MSEPTEPERLRAEAASNFVYSVFAWRGRSPEFMQAQVRKLERIIAAALSTAAATADKLRDRNQILEKRLDESQKELSRMLAESANLRREVEELKAEISGLEGLVAQHEKASKKS